jgi:hypothetical protein
MDLRIEALALTPIAVVRPALDIVYRMHTPQPIPIVDDDDDDDGNGGGSGGGNIDPDDDEGWSDDDEDDEDETLWTRPANQRSPPKRS